MTQRVTLVSSFTESLNWYNQSWPVASLSLVAINRIDMYPHAHTATAADMYWSFWSLVEHHDITGDVFVWTQINTSAGYWIRGPIIMSQSADRLVSEALLKWPLQPRNLTLRCFTHEGSRRVCNMSILVITQHRPWSCSRERWTKTVHPLTGELWNAAEKIQTHLWISQGQGPPRSAAVHKTGSRVAGHTWVQHGVPAMEDEPPPCFPSFPSCQVTETRLGASVRPKFTLLNLCCELLTQGSATYDSGATCGPL